MEIRYKFSSQSLFLNIPPLYSSLLITSKAPQAVHRILPVLISPHLVCVHACIENPFFPLYHASSKDEIHTHSSRHLEQLVTLHSHQKEAMNAYKNLLFSTLTVDVMWLVLSRACHCDFLQQ